MGAACTEINRALEYELNLTNDTPQRPLKNEAISLAYNNEESYSVRAKSIPTVGSNFGLYRTRGYFLANPESPFPQMKFSNKNERDGKPKKTEEEKRREELHSYISESKFGTKKKSHSKPSALKKAFPVTTMMKLIKKFSKVDICFVCDVTGSMSPHFEAVKKKIRDIIEFIRTEFSLNTGLAFVGYRDYNDKQKYKVIDFMQDVEEFSKELNTIVCDGGGDESEDVIGGLLNSLRLSWSSNYTFIYLIADAPNHGSRYHEDTVGDSKSNYTDNFENLPKIYEFQGVVYRRSIEDVVKLICARRHALIVYKCSNTFEKMLKIMREIYKANSNAELEVRESIKGDPKLDENFLSDFTQSFSASFDTYGKKKTGAYGKDEIAWNPNLVGTIWEFKRYNPVIKGKWSADRGLPPEVEFDAGYGKESLIWGKRISGGAFKDCYQFGDKINHYAAKKTREKHYMKITDILPEITPLLVSNEMAKIFNKLCKDYPGFININFLDAVVFQYLAENKSNDFIKASEYFMAETMLDGTYLKYSNNNGWVNTLMKDTKEYEIAHAFSHWTYHYSKGEIMIIDIQGTADSKSLNWTDCAPQSRDKHYGETDQGLVGMGKFFGSHTCNNLCKFLKLPNERALAKEEELKPDMDVIEEISHDESLVLSEKRIEITDTYEDNNDGVLPPSKGADDAGK